MTHVMNKYSCNHKRLHDGHGLDTGCQTWRTDIRNHRHRSRHRRQLLNVRCRRIRSLCRISAQHLVNPRLERIGGSVKILTCRLRIHPTIHRNRRRQHSNQATVNEERPARVPLLQGRRQSGTRENSVAVSTKVIVRRASRRLYRCPGKPPAGTFAKARPTVNSARHLTRANARPINRRVRRQA